MKPVLPWLLLAACGSDGVQPGTPCHDLCTELVEECAYEAFPTFGSCLDGCAYGRDQGLDVRAELACVQDAACDPFAVVECDHAHGLD